MLRKKESLLQRSSDSLRKRSLRLPTVHSVSQTAQIPPTWQIPAYPLPLPLDLAAGSPCALCMWAMPSYPSGLAVSRVRPPQSPECSLQRLHRQLSGVRGAGSAHPASAPTYLLREPHVSEGLSQRPGAGVDLRSGPGIQSCAHFHSMSDISPADVEGCALSI